MDRRDFLAKAGLLATWAGVTIKITGCGDDGSSGGDTMGPGNGGDVTGSVGTNHDHTVTITEAQLNAGVGVTLELTTGAGHTHMLELTANEVMEIGAGMQVVKDSSFDSGHVHTVTFN